jgi:hypothetical protein
MVKVDIIIEQHEIRDAQIKCRLNPVKRLDGEITGYDGEIKVGPLVIGLDELSQLDGIIEQLTDFRKVWGSNEARMIQEYKAALARNYK